LAASIAAAKPRLGPIPPTSNDPATSTINSLHSPTRPTGNYKTASSKKSPNNNFALNSLYLKNYPAVFLRRVVFFYFSPAGSTTVNIYMKRGSPPKELQMLWRNMKLIKVGNTVHPLQ
jgi:hypothetical protein